MNAGRRKDGALAYILIISALIFFLAMIYWVGPR